AAPPAPLAPPAPPAVDVADAFAEMLAAEQGEPRAASPARPAPPPPAPPAFEITDALIERIAAEVARRLVGGPLRDAVADVVGASAERLVREEIERIRAKTREG
ncbi:MAG: hypothetical protein AB1635_02965, partial [Acidobacteriota bacterium]